MPSREPAAADVESRATEYNPAARAVSEEIGQREPERVPEEEDFVVVLAARLVLLVHRGFRHKRPRRSEEAARGAELTHESQSTRRFGGGFRARQGSRRHVAYERGCGTIRR